MTKRILLKRVFFSFEYSPNDVDGCVVQNLNDGVWFNIFTHWSVHHYSCSIIETVSSISDFTLTFNSLETSGALVYGWLVESSEDIVVHSFKICELFWSKSFRITRIYWRNVSTLLILDCCLQMVNMTNVSSHTSSILHFYDFFKILLSLNIK